MRFRELSDEEWKFVEPLLPPRARTGRPRADDRRTVNGMLYVLITVVGGWICLEGTARIRLVGGGLRNGVGRMYGPVSLRP
ncbi:MAG: transposase [Candidatus Methanomethylicia archaeon]